MKISIDAIKNGKTQLFYTLDGTTPTNKSNLYKSDIIITESTTIKAIAYNEFGKSAVITNSFMKKDQGVSLNLESKYANQYAAAGKFALIDKTHGTDEYRTGDWQGYWAQDLVAEVSFDKPRFIETIGVGFLSDIKSWIFLPNKVEFLVSHDGQTFKQLETLEIEKPTKADMYPHHKNFQIKTNATQGILKIRMIAKNHGKCPEWHLGNGNDTWLFADEIFFE
jgi:hypothetical protein